MTSRATREDVANRRASAISAMISSLQRGENRHYHVGLVGYYIEGECYSADGLSVDLTATPGIRQTDTGFVCTATFSPKMLLRSTVEANGISKIEVGGKTQDTVRVRLEVMTDDIWLIAELINGGRRDIFLDSEALKLGLRGFSSKPH